MTIIEEEPIYPARAPSFRYLDWSPAVAGALVATALSAVLIAFGTAVGLGVAVMFILSFFGLRAAMRALRVASQLAVDLR